MEGFLKQSTAVNITVLMIDSADHITGKTGLTLTIYATKAAGTPAAITPTVTELDSTNVKGLYKLALTTGHTDTLGEFQLHVTSTGADPADLKWQVSTYLPGEAATLQADQAVNVTKVNGTTQTARDLGASVLLSAGTGTGQLDFTSGVVKSNPVQWLGGTIPAVNVTGVPKVDVVDWLGQAALADSSNLPHVNCRDWAGDLIPVPANVGTPKVDVFDWNGSAVLSLVNGYNRAVGPVINTGTATAGTTSTITLAAGASATDNWYNDNYLIITSGTGSGNPPRLITGYVGATKVATVTPNFATTPDATSVYMVVAQTRQDVGAWLASVPNALISGRVDANAQVVGDKTGYALGSNGLDSTALTTAAKNAVADSVLDRNMATGVDSGTDSTTTRTPRQALRVLRNKASIAAGTLTVTKEDDATASWTAAVTTTAGNPISTVDPT